MTFDNQWKKFIQVNIYGQTIQDLQKNGVVLETMLNDVGCSKVWIVEGSMYNGEDSHHPSTDDDDVTVVVPAFSTTIAETKCPRFSTPLQSQVDLQSKFTLNLPFKFSEIDSSFEEEQDDQEIGVEDDCDVEQMLDELVDQVSERFELEKNPVLSTTIVNVDVPRSSTPIVSEFNVKPELVFSLPETLSDIASSDDDAIVTDQSFEEMTTSERKPLQLPPPILRSHTKSMMPTGRPLKTVKKRTSAISKLSNPETTAPKQRKVLKKSVSAVQNEQKAKLVTKEVSVIPVHISNVNRKASIAQYSSATEYAHELMPVKRESERHIDPLLQLSNQASERVYHDLKTMVIAGEENNALQRQQEDTMVMEHQLKEVVEGNDRGISFDMDYGDGNYGDEEETGGGNYFSLSGNDDTELMIVERENSTKHTPPPPHLISTTKSIMRTGEGAKPKKTVSFGVPRNKMSAKQKKLDEIHNIECQHNGCGKVFAWKIRYGKQRLLDHVMKHFGDKCIVCRMCEQTFSTSRQTHYHYKKSHPEVKCSTFKILDVFNMEMDDFSITDLFNKCFEPQLPIIGNVGKMRNLRRSNKEKKEKKKKEEGKEEEVDEMAEDDDDDDKETVDPSTLF